MSASLYLRDRPVITDMCRIAALLLSLFVAGLQLVLFFFKNEPFIKYYLGKKVKSSQSTSCLLPHQQSKR